MLDIPVGFVSRLFPVPSWYQSH